MDFLKILQALSKGSAEFIIVGGVAARLYGSTRLTHDIDLVPRLDAETWAEMIDLVWDMGGRPRIPETREAVKNLTNVRAWVEDKGMLALSFRSSDGTSEVDFLVSESPNYDSLKANARRVEVDGLVYWVAGLDDLIEMKRAAGRPQDLLDIEQLTALRRE